MTSGCQEENLLLTEKTHRSSQIRLDWSTIGSVEADNDVVKGSNRLGFLLHKTLHYTNLVVLGDAQDALSVRSKIQLQI